MRFKHLKKKAEENETFETKKQLKKKTVKKTSFANCSVRS